MRFVECGPAVEAGLLCVPLRLTNCLPTAAARSAVFLQALLPFAKSDSPPAVFCVAQHVRLRQMLVYSLFQFSEWFPEHPELGQACRALGSVKSHSGKGVNRLVACVARGCDCNRLYGSEQQGPQGVSLTCEPLACYPRGSLEDSL